MATRQDNVRVKISAEDKASRSIKKIRSQVIGMVGAYVGLKSAYTALKSIVKVGAEHERIWTNVGKALERHNQAAAGGVASVKAYADQLQTLTGISDEVIGTGVKMFVDYGQTLDGAMETMRVAADFAAGSGFQLKTAVDLLAKASVGYTGTLSRYGLIVDESLSKTEKFAAAVDLINERFGGAASDQAETAAVRMSLLSEKVGDLQEDIFKLFGPELTSGTNILIDSLGALSSVMSFFAPEIRGTNEEADKLYETLLKLNGATLAGSDMMETTLERYRDYKVEIRDVSIALLELAATTEGVKEFQRVQEKLAAGVALLPEDIERAVKNMELFETISSDATSVLVEGLTLASAAFKQYHETTKLTEEEFTRLMEMWREIPKAFMGDDVIEEELEEYLGGIRMATEGVVMLEKERLDKVKALERLAFDASLIGKQEHVQQLLEVERWYNEQLAIIAENEHATDAERKAAQHGVEILNKQKRAEVWKAYHKEIAKQNDEAFAKMRKQAEEFTRAIGGILNSYLDQWVDALIEQRSIGQEFWKAMANDFAKFFIKQALAKVADVFVPGLGSILGSIFDTPKYDRLAMQQGEHFIYWFGTGAEHALDRLNLGPQLAAAGAPAVAASLGIPGQPTSGSQVNIYQGVVTEDFIRQDVVPAVSLASKRKETSLIAVTDEVFGGSRVFNA